MDDCHRVYLSRYGSDRGPPPLPSVVVFSCPCGACGMDFLEELLQESGHCDVGFISGCSSNSEPATPRVERDRRPDDDDFTRSTSASEPPTMVVARAGCPSHQRRAASCRTQLAAERRLKFPRPDARTKSDHRLLSTKMLAARFRKMLKEVATAQAERLCEVTSDVNARGLLGDSTCLQVVPTRRRVLERITVVVRKSRENTGRHRRKFSYSDVLKVGLLKIRCRRALATILQCSPPTVSKMQTALATPPHAHAQNKKHNTITILSQDLLRQSLDKPSFKKGVRLDGHAALVDGLDVRTCS